MKETTPQLALVHPCFFWLLSLPLDYFEGGRDLSTKPGAVRRLIRCTKAAWNKRAALASQEISQILCRNVLILLTYSRADELSEHAGRFLASSSLILISVSMSKSSSSLVSASQAECLRSGPFCLPSTWKLSFVITSCLDYCNSLTIHAEENSLSRLDVRGRTPH